MAKKKGTKYTKPKEEKPIPADAESEEAVEILINKSVEDVVKIVKETEVKSISVVFTPFKDQTVRHGGRSNTVDYIFSGKVPVTITNSADIKFFKLKAEKNPDRWMVI